MNQYSMRIDRRAFLVGSGLTFATASLGALSLPLVLPGAAAAPLAGHLDDWTVDDMWTGYPRPAQPIGFGSITWRQHGVSTARVTPPGSIEALFA